MYREMRKRLVLNRGVENEFVRNGCSSFERHRSRGLERHRDVLLTRDLDSVPIFVLVLELERTCLDSCAISSAHSNLFEYLVDKFSIQHGVEDDDDERIFSKVDLDSDCNGSRHDWGMRCGKGRSVGAREIR